MSTATQGNGLVNRVASVATTEKVSGAERRYALSSKLPGRKRYRFRKGDERFVLSAFPSLNREGIIAAAREELRYEPAVPAEVSGMTTDGAPRGAFEGDAAESLITDAMDSKD